MLSEDIEHVIKHITDLHHGLIVLVVSHLSIVLLVLGVTTRVAWWISMTRLHHTTLCNHFIQLFELLVYEISLILLLFS